jgi:hypothetical protein
MNTKDLMLGNYLIYKLKLYRLVALNSTSVVLQSVENTEEVAVLPSEIEPVPLDDKWLERLPMVKRPDRTDSYGGWLVRVHPFHWIRIKDGGWDSGVGKIDLTYVHQLQNLYKILTNSELY